MTSDTSKLKITDLNTTNEVKGKLCLKTPDYYVPLGNKLTDKVTFGAGLEFCKNIGGEMAVIGRLTSLHFTFPFRLFDHTLNLEIVFIFLALLCFEV